MNRNVVGAFDCVQSARDIRDRLSSQIETMSFDELHEWLKGHRFPDPVLARLAERAARQAEKLKRLRVPQ